MPEIRNILSFDVEDWHQSTYDLDLPVGSRVVDNTRRILDMLETSRTYATFFVLGVVAENFPELVRRIHDGGHEVACHGYSHLPVRGMSREQFREDLKRSMALVQDAAGSAVLGYRAPDFSIFDSDLWALEILAEEGLLYDSSIFPFAGPRYGIPAAFRQPHRVVCASNPDFLEFPLATLKLGPVRLPAAGGGYFRLLPYRFMRSAVRRMNAEGSPATTYFHPYELDTEEIRGSTCDIPWHLRLSQGLGRRRVERRLGRLLRDFAWGPARDWLGQGIRLTGGRILDLAGPTAGGWRSIPGGRVE
jgi:polysaccharide deacetylase family protein (PEP-CTERM system associated)